MPDVEASRHKRNRIIAIVAGSITVVAIVLGFAGDFLGLGWRWMRPAAELLLLAELVALVVIERHQLFEPVHEHVSDIREVLSKVDLAEMQATLGFIREQISAAGQVTFCVSAAEVLRALTRSAREAFARDQQEPQILRICALSGRVFVQQRWGLSDEIGSMAQSVLAYGLPKDSSADSRARRWSVRILAAMASLETFEAWYERVGRAWQDCVNIEVKILPRMKVEAILSPQMITDRDVIMSLDDASGVYNWGVLFQGRQYAAAFSRWFDDLWSNVPDTYQLYSRAGFNQRGFEQIKARLATIDHDQASYH